MPSPGTISIGQLSSAQVGGEILLVISRLIFSLQLQPTLREMTLH